MSRNVMRDNRSDKRRDQTRESQRLKPKPNQTTHLSALLTFSVQEDESPFAAIVQDTTREDMTLDC